MLKTARRGSWGRQWHAGQQQQESRRQVHRNAWRKESPASYQTFQFPTDGTEPWEKRTHSQSVGRSSEGLPCHSSGSEECLSATLHSEQPHHMWGYDEQKGRGCLHMEFRARRLKQHSLLRTSSSAEYKPWLAAGPVLPVETMTGQ